MQSRPGRRVLCSKLHFEEHDRAQGNVPDVIYAFKQRDKLFSPRTVRLKIIYESPLQTTSPKSEDLAENHVE
jgi:hypothetical protein